MATGCPPAEEPDAKEATEPIRAEGRGAVALPGDVGDEAFCRRLVADAVQGLGGLNALPVHVLLASREASYATGQAVGASGGGGNPLGPRRAPNG